jgi:hypothetical protein
MYHFEGVNVGRDDTLIILIRVFSGRTYEGKRQIPDVPHERQSLQFGRVKKVIARGLE